MSIMFMDYLAVFCALAQLGLSERRPVDDIVLTDGSHSLIVGTVQF